MATLDDLKKILEDIRNQNAAAATAAGQPRPPDPLRQQEALSAAQEKADLAQQEVDSYRDMQTLAGGLFASEEDRNKLAKASYELELAKLNVQKQSLIVQGQYNQAEADRIAQEQSQLKQQEQERQKQQQNRVARKQATKEYLGQQTQILKNSLSMSLNQTAAGSAISNMAGKAFSMVKPFASIATSAASFAMQLFAAGVALKVIAAIVLPLMVIMAAIAAVLIVIGTSVAVVGFLASLAIAARDAAASFTLATGASMNFGKEMVQVHESLVMAGVSLEDANKAYTALYKNTTIFSRALPEQRKRMGSFVALLEKWGVSSETSAKAMETSVIALGISVNRVGDTMSELAEHAKYLGTDVATYMQEFAGLGGELAVYSDAVGTFKSLAAAQKLTGMEMRKIIDLARKFDTFEGAATMAGNLNAALGGNFVNAMDMMTETDPVRRFEMIRDALREGGESFENMGYYAKRFYMEQLGLKDVSELAQLMRGDLNELTGDYGKSADELLAARQRTREYQGTLESLKNLLMTLRPVFVNLIDPIQNVVKTLVGPGGPTDTFLKLRESIEKVATDAMIPFITKLPETIERISAWAEENRGLLDSLLAVIPPMVRLVTAIGKLMGLAARYNTGGVGASAAMLQGDEAAVEKGLDQMARARDELPFVLRMYTLFPHYATTAAIKVGTFFSNLATGVEDSAAAMNKRRSPSFLEALAIQNEQLAKMPGNVTNAARAMVSMKSPISSATAEMNKLGESTDMAAEKAKKLFNPGALRANANIQVGQAMTNRATAGITAPSPATQAIAQNAAPLVRQPIEVTLRTEEGVLAKQVINVIGREIQSVIA